MSARITRRQAKRQILSVPGVDPALHLDDDAAMKVLSELGHVQLCRLSCASHRWQWLCSSDSVWRQMLLKRWPLLPIVPAAGACDVYRKLLPKAKTLPTLPRDVVLMVEVHDDSGAVLVQGAFPVHELETRDVGFDFNGVSDFFVLTFPSLLNNEAYQRVVDRFASSTVCLLRRDGKVVRADAYEDDHQQAWAGHADHHIFPGPARARRKMQIFSASKDPSVRLLEASIKLLALDEDRRGQWACAIGFKEVSYSWIYVCDEDGNERDELELAEDNDGPYTRFWPIKNVTTDKESSRMTDLLSMLCWE
jgi:hypothetical protein